MIKTLDNGNIDESYISIFDELYDVAVYSAGYIGFSAATALAHRGLKVLLIETSGQLLWESGAALESAADVQNACPAWTALMQEQGCGRWLRPAGMEIYASEKLQQLRKTAGLRTLFHTRVVGGHRAGVRLSSVVLATKAGLHAVRARFWVDASETGSMYRLCTQDASEGRSADCAYHSFCVQSARWPEFEERFNAWANRHGMDVVSSALKTERRVRWRADGGVYYKGLCDRINRLREEFPHDLVISHSSHCPFPVYAEVECRKPTGLENLSVLSPGYQSQALSALGERFQLGAAFAARVDPVRLDYDPPEPDADWRDRLPIAATEVCEVLVAGAGTAGAMAAVASSTEGARTCALDQALFPGGAGIAGGITAYFCGKPGGIQEVVNRRTQELSSVLYGEAVAENIWHQDAKKIALFERFDAAGVDFVGETLLCGVETDGRGRVTAALAACEQGLVRYEATAFIDCTGDADLCVFAGAEFAEGRPGDGRSLAFSLSALTLQEMTGGLVIKNQNFDAGWVDATDPEDISRARLMGIGQYGTLPADNSMDLLAFAPVTGIRQSRHIRTDYMLSLHDLIGQHELPDVVGDAGAHADTHSVDFEFEDDEALFFYWACRLFRYPLSARFPYRMLLPERLENVWVACRAAGMEMNAFYAIRMQRDVQRMGEVAGMAAALSDGCSRNVAVDELQRRMSLPALPDLMPEMDPLVALANGRSGTSLWAIYSDREKYNSAVVDILGSENPSASFYAACVLAMWREERAEDRLLLAIARREVGEVEPTDNRGAFGQEIDIPFWLLAVNLLRRCGTGRCLDRLQELLASPEGAVFNVRTAVALTVERLVERGQVLCDEVIDLIEQLSISDSGTSYLPPSHSVVRALRREPQMVLPNDIGAAVRSDHQWQLHLVIDRTRARLGLARSGMDYGNDARAYVRRAYAHLEGKHLGR